MHTTQVSLPTQDNQLQEQEYDVVIMGAGFVGNCQARHLLLKIPNIKIALIDPRPEDRTDKDLKLGESMVEIAALFVYKELGLYEYMVENHPPKFGLNFHWPKNPTKTESIDDYYHIWTHRQPPIASFQMNRAKFERDLLKMNKDMGVIFYNGRVVDVDLTPGDALNIVKIKVGSEKKILKAKHVIDAAGRKFIIGHKTDNLLFGPDNLFGVNTGSAWLRVKNVDRTIFHNGYDPTGTSTSHYYATNHWFGHGHWLWMIPTEMQDTELSIGIIQHHDVIPADRINTLDKFLGFLKTNHNMLYRLIMSGENVDFHYWPRIAHSSKTMFSQDNWYVVGDSACIFDAFYSLGTTMATFAMESVTEIIRAKQANEADAEKKRSAYNEFNLTFSRYMNRLMSYHSKHLGNASIMSWRIYFEYMWWFGVLVPFYVGKWHLDTKFLPTFIKPIKGNMNGLFKDIYLQFNKLVERGTNIGFMDCYRADQLVGEYYTAQHFDSFLVNSKFEPHHCNVFAGIKYTHFYVAIWYMMFQWKGFGLAGLLAPRSLYNFFRLLALSAHAGMGELLYRYQMRGVPANTQVAKTREEFQHYQYQSELQPWSEDNHKLSSQETAAKDKELSKVQELSVSV
ncbi:tryptophan 7-halogenase [Aetokthonos hydrillicola Thurmond2011]|jgi:flavin-dependent dehydrogenase|uniref:Tryptophan 7-halogenase n=1 Tax=Aetokthonos hydrillicola Thurmond2011 TaxID=2712845 RepID=A0AAP5MDF0_9CYAN|nr:tryptophan 7-halogenase [Aetokthonos hydrillicola]MBO3462729.1 tryptophan halogenase [Aetokthonos hydrillicola CCALA 1050]MBW4585735.1 tryptophan 7-halogenase [Aetokthonos hydrillicola CCALA 1050]MDR9899239.1 tryptophan 7-halogenase [Aetokthonos hydrillicola Thurmond2011]